MKRDQRLRTLALVVFFLSGISGLIYQVVWTKLLGLTMGNSMLSITTVVSAFMAGLALGSFVAGRLVDRIRSPYLVFGILEAIVGLYCLVIPSIIDGTEPILRSIYQSMGPEFLLFRIIQFLVCGGVLIFPTILMGATLPMLAKHVASRFDHVGWNVGRLYALNTFGAVVGAFMTGFLLIPYFGHNITIYVGVGINLAVALVVVISWFATRKAEVATQEAAPAEASTSSSPPSEAAPEPSSEIRELPSWARFAVFASFLLSGFAAMVFQIGWTRVLALVFGPSVYNFSLTVATFILGLAIGALIAARIVDRTKDLLLLFAGCQLLVGLSGLGVIYMFGRLPIDLLDLYLAADQMSFGVFQFSKFCRAFVMMLIPTILMGGVFPIAARILARDLRMVGRAVGDAYAVNTVGSILGSFSTGFLFVPWLGIRGALMLGVGLNFAVGLLLLLTSVKWSGIRLRTVAAAILVPAFAVVLVMPPWDTELLSSGVYLYAQRHRDVLGDDPSKIREVMLGSSKLLYHKEGITTTVSVRESDDGLIYMKTSGKTDASSAEDMYTQVFCGHLPLFLHPDPKEVCVIGLGSGVTLGATSMHDIDFADCVEISAGVVEGAEFFSEVNHNALAQPDRLRIIVEDGRNFLKMSGRRYDAILSEPSNPWIAGIGSLFTKEYFEACRKSLKPGGIMTQWANTYNMGESDFRSVLRTFQEVFPNSALWECILGTDYILVGLPDDYPGIDYQRIAKLFESSAVADDLERIGIATPESFLKHFVFGDQDMARFSDGVPIHFDEHTFLEYSLPKNLYLSAAAKDQHYVKFLTVLRKSRRTAMPELVLGDIGIEEKQRIGATLVSLQRSRNLATDGWIELISRRGFSQPLSLFREALEIDPVDGDTRSHLASLLQELAKSLLTTEAGIPQAYLLLKESLAIKESSEVRQYLIQVGIGVAQRLMIGGELDLAFKEFLGVWKVDKSNREAVLGLAEVHEKRGNLKEAVRMVRLGLEAHPEDAEFFNRAGSIHFEMRDLAAAVRDWQSAVRIEPEQVRYRNNLATTLDLLGREDEAMIQYRRIQDLDPNYPQAHIGLGRIYMKKGDFDRASESLVRALRLKPDMNELSPVLYSLLATDARRGELDRAFHWLSEVVRLRLVAPAEMRRDAALDPLKDDPRFEEVLMSWVEPDPTASAQ